MLAPTLTKTKFSGYFQTSFCDFEKVLDKSESLIEKGLHELFYLTCLSHRVLIKKNNNNKNEQNKQILLRAF